MKSSDTIAKEIEFEEYAIKEQIILTIVIYSFY